jgi:hypothetical protein
MTTENVPRLPKTDVIGISATESVAYLPKSHDAVVEA